jgi:hypothetical protein
LTQVKQLRKQEISIEIMIEIGCTVTIESFHLMTFILENVLCAFNYFIVTTGTLIPSTTTAPPVSTKSTPKVASVSSTVLPESTTSSEKQTNKTQKTFINDKFFVYL